MDSIVISSKLAREEAERNQEKLRRRIDKMKEAQDMRLAERNPLRFAALYPERAQSITGLTQVEKFQ